MSLKYRRRHIDYKYKNNKKNNRQANDGEIIKEVTDIYVSTLPAEEQEKIRMGIEVIGEESLINILQDYGS